MLRGAPRGYVAAAALAVGLGGAGLILVYAPRAGEALVVSRPIADPDAIVSLASHEWERLPAAARLARMFPTAAVVLTLPVPVTRFNCHDCASRVHRLELAGVAASRVRTVALEAGGTYGEALAVRQWAQTHGARRVVVVTSPYHTRRALATFSKELSRVGVTVGVEPAAESPARPGRWWTNAYDRAYVRYEWAALLYYAVRLRLHDP